jgi:hypothetical protein
VRLKLEAEQIGSARIDIGVDARGEFFDVSFVGNGDAAKLEVVDIASADRHLLLLVRNGAEKSKFLCGHDERHWFVAAVPEQARGVTGVTPAKAALQPALVSAAVARARPKDRFRRRNPAYVRQGEWFFVPALGLQPDAVPTGAAARPCGPTGRIRPASARSDTAGCPRTSVGAAGGRRSSGIRRCTREAQSVTRITQRSCCRTGTVVVMNTEHEAQAMRHVVFLD